MTYVSLWAHSAFAKSLGLTLLHSLWEGAAIALLLAIALGVAQSSRVRYAAACAAMLALLAAFGVTLARVMPQNPSAIDTHRVIHPAVTPLPVEHVPAKAIRRWDTSDALPWLAPLWMLGVLLFQLRCLASWMAAGRLRRRGVCGPPEIWIARLDQMRLRLRMTTPVLLLESCLAEVPVVIGHMRPVILMPVGLLTGLPVGQLESILLHELAHIRRADYLVNLMQTMIEGLLFYHPAAWWISHVIRNERENCCDDLVIATRGNAHEYASALAALATNRSTLRDAALAASGGNIVKRIRRVLSQPEGPRTSLAPMASAATLIVTGAVALAAWQSPPRNVPAPVPAGTQQIPPPSLAPAQAAPARALLIARSEAPAQDSVSPAAMPAPYWKWLNEEVPYIITDQERRVFKSLTSDHDRDVFISQFWARRDPTAPPSADQYPAIPKGNPDNEFRREHDRRIAYANERFDDKKIPGWKTDRGRIYIQYGPPDEIESHPSGGAYTRAPEQGGGQVNTVPFEQWKYKYLQGIGNNIIMEFVDKGRTGEYRLTMDPSAKEHPEQEDQAANQASPLPIKVHVSFEPLNLSAVLTQITVEFETKDLHFSDNDTVSTATVNIYGRISTLSHRPLSPFEDVVRITQPTTLLPALIEKIPSQTYQRTLPLARGIYRLEIVAKEEGSLNPSTYSTILAVPQDAAH